MGNNFEAKHPRAKDGKFTEKYRAESGIELSVEKPFTPPDTPEDCERGQVFVGKLKRHDPYSPAGDMTEYEAPGHDEILDGDWHLVEKIKYYSGPSALTYQTSDGFVQEFYGKDGGLGEQDFLDRDFKPAQGTENWAEKHWYENGKLARRIKNAVPENEEEIEFLEDYIADNGGKLTVAEFFDRQGRRKGQRCYETNDGELFEVRENCYPDGRPISTASYSFDGIDCAPENEPCYYAVKDGVVQVAQYKVRRGNGSVFHCTNGPAIIDRRAPEGKQERYFLEGVEYSKEDWEKKVGR